MFKQLSDCGKILKGCMQAETTNRQKRYGNGVEVLQSVTKTERRKGVKNADLSYGSELRVKWSIKNNQLGLTVNLGKKPFTRRGMLLLISKI